MAVSLKEFLSNVLLLQPSVFDDLSSSGVTDNLQECTNFFNGDDWKEVLSTTNSASPVVVRKLTRLSELICKTSVEEVGMLKTLEQFNNLYTARLMSTNNNDSSIKKRKEDHNNSNNSIDQGGDSSRHKNNKTKQKKHKKRKLAPQPHHHGRPLCLDDVIAPADPADTSAVAENNEASIDPPPRFDAVARGMLWRRDNKELRFDGMWTSSREAFDDDKSPKSEISFWLEEEQEKEEEATKIRIQQQEPPLVGRLKTTGEENCGGQLIPVDSANFQGFFKVQRDDGAYDTFTDDQIVLKFRENNLGGYNIYGKGRNCIGLFTISGTVASEWGTGSNSSHAELYRTYLIDGPSEDTSSTDAADSSGSPIQSASNTTSNSFPVGTAVRKFFVPDGETHARPFVGHIIDVFDCDEEIDGKVVTSSQHSILYEDGDVEDLDYCEIKPSVEDAKRNKIANMDLTEVKKWETDVYQKYPKNQQNQDSSFDQHDPLPLEYNPDVSSKVAAAPAANESHQQANHESSEEQNALQPPLWQQQQQQLVAENGSHHYENGRHPGNQRWPQQHAYHHQQQCRSYNQSSLPGQMSQRRSYHQTPGETRNLGPDPSRNSQQDHETDEMRKLVHVMTQYLNRFDPNLHRKAMEIIRTCSQRYPQSSKEKYRQILFYSKKLVGDEIWNKVYHYYRNLKLEVRRRNMEARSGQSSQQDTSQRRKADPAALRRGSGQDYENAGIGSGRNWPTNEMQHNHHGSISTRQQQQYDTRYMSPTHGVAPPNFQQQYTMAGRQQYGSPTHSHHMQRPHSMQPLYGRRSNFQQQASMANRQAYNRSAYNHPGHHPHHPSSQQRYEGGSSFRLETPTAYQGHHDAASRSDPRNSNGDGDHVHLPNSDNEAFDPIQNANIAGEAENLCLPQESDHVDENLTHHQLPANNETVVHDRNEDGDDIVQKSRKDLKAEADSNGDDSSSGEEESLTEKELSGKTKEAKGKNDDKDDFVQKMRKDLESEGDKSDDDSSSGDEKSLSNRQQNQIPPKEKDILSDNSTDDDSDVELEEKYQELVSGLPKKKKKRRVAIDL